MSASDPQSGSPAEKAGLRAGDTILAVNGDEVKTARDLAFKIGNLSPDEQVTLSVWRDGARTDMPVTLGTMPGQEQVAAADLVLDCCDNFATRHAVNRACVAQRKPLVSGAAIRFAGQISVFDLRHDDAPFDDAPGEDQP